jgi:hypothetical protein
VPRLPISLLDFKRGLRMLVRYPALTVVGGLAMAFAIWRCRRVRDRDVDRGADGAAAGRRAYCRPARARRAGEQEGAADRSRHRDLARRAAVGGGHRRVPLGVAEPGRRGCADTAQQDAEHVTGQARVVGQGPGCGATWSVYRGRQDRVRRPDCLGPEQSHGSRSRFLAHSASPASRSRELHRALDIEPPRSGAMGDCRPLSFLGVRAPLPAGAPGTATPSRVAIRA